MDAEIAALEHRRAKTRAIKQGMMQALLTGRAGMTAPETFETLWDCFSIGIASHQGA